MKYSEVYLTVTCWDVSGRPIEAIRPDGSRVTGRLAVKAELERLKAEAQQEPPVLGSEGPKEGR